MPKDNCDSMVHLMLVAHADSLGFLLNPRVVCCINSFRINPFHQVSVGSTDPWHHSMTLNQESFTWSHTKV